MAEPLWTSEPGVPVDNLSIEHPAAKRRMRKGATCFIPVAALLARKGMPLAQLGANAPENGDVQESLAGAANFFCRIACDQQRNAPTDLLALRGVNELDFDSFSWIVSVHIQETLRRRTENLSRPSLHYRSLKELARTFLQARGSYTNSTR